MSRPLGITLLSLILLGSVSAQETPDDEVYLEIDGEKIRVDEFENALFEMYGVQFTNEFILNWVLEREAQKRSVTVTDETVQQRIDERFDQILQSQFQGDLERFSTALATEGYTPSTWKTWLKFTMRPDMLAEELIRRTREVTEAELREAWERQYGPDGVKRTIRHLLVSSNYANSEEYKIDHYNAERDVIGQAALQSARAVLQELQSGASFADLAREHSDDFSAESGGSLGKNWKSRIGLEFDRVIDGLSPGGVSEVFETRRGYHIARVDGIEDGYEFQASHLLLGAALNNLPQAEREGREREVLERAKSILEQLRQHPDEFVALARAESEDRTTKTGGGSLGTFPRGRMASEFEEALLSMEPGEIAGPVKTRFGYHIIRLEGKTRKPQLDTKLVSHILFSTEFYKVREKKLKPVYERRAYEKISNLFSQIEAGKSFEELVRANSDDSYSRQRGGVIENYTPALFGEEFDQAIQTLQPEDRGRIVKSPRGYHIVQVTAIQETPFESVSTGLRVELLARPITPVEVHQYKEMLRSESSIVDTWNINHAGGSIETLRPKSTSVGR